MRLLELFSGTKSISKAVGHFFAETVSVDILEKFNPTHCSDILKWNYKQYPPGYFDVIWSSPPCTHYSVAKTQGVRDISGSNAIVAKTIEIIEYFNPSKWFIENPQTGLLKEQEVVAGLPFYDVDYCQYGYLYRKRTRIWTNIENFTGKECPGVGKCPAMKGTRHINSCGNGYTSDKKTSSIYSGRKCTERPIPIDEKYSIPAGLIKELFS
jgi:hypothetical protein